MIQTKMIKRIGVFTSGGDSPGMNAAIRAVVRTSVFHGIEVYGIYRGFEGLIEGDIQPLYSHSVSNIIQRGGTILKTARSERFKTPEGRKVAYENLLRNNIDALVAIGGNGTFTGCKVFSEEYDISVIGLPGTIDNDLYGTDYTIGYDTAINTVMQAVDKLRDTADAHERFFFVEVMGRDAGFIAIQSGIASGAEAILIPETKTTVDDLVNTLVIERRKNKTSGIVIVAEGDDMGGAIKVADKVKERFSSYETRVSILGHIQRGGSPTCSDRVLASKLGYESVMALINGEKNVMIGIINKEVTYTQFGKAIKHHLQVDKDVLKMAVILST